MKSISVMKSFAALTFASSLFLGGCAPWHPHPGPGPMGTTLGHQLIDLKEAHDRGALTDQEYADVKARELELVEQHGKMEPHDCGMEKPKDGECHHDKDSHCWKCHSADKGKGPKAQ